MSENKSSQAVNSPAWNKPWELCQNFPNYVKANVGNYLLIVGSNDSQLATKEMREAFASFAGTFVGV